MNQEMRNQLMEVVKKNAGKKPEGIEFTEDTSLIKVFGYDSIKVVQLIVELEEVFDIEIDDMDIDFNDLLHFGSLEKYVAKLIEER